jgi:maltooligosyltrehalose synthase
MSDIARRYHNKMVREAADLTELQPSLTAFNDALQAVMTASLPHTNINQVFQSINQTYQAMIGGAMQADMNVGAEVMEEGLV